MKTFQIHLFTEGKYTFKAIMCAISIFLVISSPIRAINSDKDSLTTRHDSVTVIDPGTISADPLSDPSFVTEAKVEIKEYKYNSFFSGLFGGPNHKIIVSDLTKGEPVLTSFMVTKATFDSLKIGQLIDKTDLAVEEYKAKKEAPNGWGWMVVLIVSIAVIVGSAISYFQRRW